MAFQKQDNEKEFVCRECMNFMDAEELISGCCNLCGSDENVFPNDLNEEE